MTDQLQDLIARLEKASGPDRYLDGCIHQIAVPSLADANQSVTGGWLIGGDHPQPVKAPEYTASIDAALTLADDGLAVMASGLERLLEKIRSGSWKSGPEVTADDIARIFATEALKARAALSGKGGAS